MNSLGKNKRFSNAYHFTSDELIRFHHHLVIGRKLHDMEKHLIDCELCSDALKGVAQMENASLLYEVSKDLHRKARKKRLWKKNIFSQVNLIAVFSVVFIILFLLLMSIFFFSRLEPTKNFPANENKTQEKK